VAASSVIMLEINISSSLTGINYIACKEKKNTHFGFSGPYNGVFIFIFIYFFYFLWSKMLDLFSSAHGGRPGRVVTGMSDVGIEDTVLFLVPDWVIVYALTSASAK